MRSGLLLSNNLWRLALSSVFTGTLFLWDGGATSAQTINPLEESVEHEPLRPATTCPAEPSQLTELMIRDLPNYTNRVLQRTVAVLPWTEEDEQRERDGAFVRRPYRPSHVLVAGQVNLTPLDLNNYTYTTESAAGGPLTQVFFTTLSRQYSGLQFSEVQEYHWIFLAQTTDGWWPAFMFSSVDNAQTSRAALPLNESSESSVGQAVQLWLRDCRSGAIRS
ncbi:MAG: hypothetical protein ACFB0D_23950 [Phormidesmis sp.]